MTGREVGKEEYDMRRQKRRKDVVSEPDEERDRRDGDMRW